MHQQHGLAPAEYCVPSLMPLTGAKPLCAAFGNVGDAGRLSHRGTAPSSRSVD